MKKRGHIILSLILNFLFIYACIYFGFKLFEVTWFSVLVVSGIIVLYGLLPDIDYKGSSVTHWFFAVGILGVIIGIAELILKTGKINALSFLIFSVLFLIVVFIASNFLSHRGIIHSIPAGILSALPLWFLFGNFWFFVFGFISWYSHLAGDGLFFKMR